MKIPKRLYSSFIFGLLLAWPLAASAVEYGGIGAKPSNPDPANPRTQSIFVYSLGTGDTKHDAVTVYNNTPSRKVISVYVVDSETSSGGAFACAQKVDKKSGVGSWVTLENEEVTLNAGANRKINFDITIPATAGVGEHDGCLVVQDGSASTKEGSGVALNFRSALRMVVTVPGATFKKLSFIELTHSMSKSGTIILKPAVKNEGNVSVDADISTSLNNLFGVSIAKDGGSYPILPHSKADWNFELKRPFWGGFYTATTQLQYDPSNRPLGSTGGTKKTIKGPQSTYWINPQPAAATIEIAIALLMLISSLYIYKRRKLRAFALTNWQSHKIKKSDTLIKLAEERGVSWQKVASINNIKAPYHLTAGDSLLLPPKKG
jgi:hypothetical protein